MRKMAEQAFTACEIRHMIETKKASAREIAGALLRRVEQADKKVNAFITVTRDQTLAEAEKIDAKVAKGEALPALAGVLVALKDNICTKGVPTTCASRMLADFVPFYSATAAEKLAAAGAVLLGKTNMDEFGMGSTNETSCYGPARNPWNPAHTPGGSSGGSAAAVAAGFVPCALGTDTGDSVRLPAAHCGVLGLRPTYGAVSRYGLVAFASSMDQIGPMARTVDDLALLFAAICGADTPRDATSREIGFDACLNLVVSGLKIGIPKEYFTGDVDPCVVKAVHAAVKTLEQAGASVLEVSLPSTPHAPVVYHALSSAEAFSNLARYDGIRYGHAAKVDKKAETPVDIVAKSRSEGFGDEVQRRVLFGALLLSGGDAGTYFRRARLLRRAIAAEFDEAFGKCHLLVTPTAAAPAARFGSGVATINAAQHYTAPASLAGLPALSVPCGLSPQGLPLGMQLIGPAGSENRLLSVAKRFESETGGFPLPEVLP